jgi:hypothetical protein
MLCNKSVLILYEYNIVAWKMYAIKIGPEAFNWLSIGYIVGL